MMHDIMGYTDGYMHKEALEPVISAAGIGATADMAAGGARVISEAGMTMIPYVLMIPALMGAGAGAMHSKMTSPSALDKETVQKSLQAAELEEFQADLTRRKTQSERSAKRSGNVNERTLHI